MRKIGRMQKRQKQSKIIVSTDKYGIFEMQISTHIFEKAS